MTAVVAGAATLGLVLVAVLADLDTAGQAASVVGAVVALAALVVSVLALGGTAPGRRVRAGRGAVAAGGNITGSALGTNSKVTGPHTPPTPARRPHDDVHASRDAIATGGDITDSALGEGSER
ncbi:hypothetical protein E5083_13320 [Streptomyces bauhiniae]|uniref:Uncharacterized protein n=1 Tax=Streptomyces bauhiniae TaxID=2340725 RepID=A0A4Z1D8L4_9ACTN|nr:hypothetical protein E5083_13320 [Streptomyces bauhiniae]